MNARKLTLIFAAAITLFAQADITLEKATRKETLEGDLKGAIELYRKAFSEAKNDRTMAARALVRMAECYQKLGDAESRKIYEQVLREYPDQKEAVNTARARLGPPAVATGPVSRSIWRAGPSRNSIRWGTLSPDGRYFCYSDLKNLFLYDLATSQARNLTNQSGSDNAYESVISPDGKQIAYNWWVRQTGRYEVRIANLSGEPNPRLLYANPEAKDLWLDDWSPDGRSLALVLDRRDKTRQIGLLNAADRSLRVLKSGDWGSIGVSSLHFSPDSKHLAYDNLQGETTRRAGVFVLAIDGTREVPAAAGPGNNTTVGWSPDGKWLLISSDRSGGKDLYAIAFANGNAQGAPQRLISTIGPNFRALGFSSSGALYYATENRFSGSQLSLGSIDYTAGKYSAVKIPNEYEESSRSPLWSRDSKSFAYESFSLDRAESKLAIRSIDAPNARLVRPSAIEHTNPINWMSDRRFVLVYGEDFKGHSALYRMNTETGEVSAMLAPVNNPSGAGRAFFPYSAVWMPDGDSFLVVATGRDPSAPKSGVYRVNSRTGERATVFLHNLFETSDNLTPSRDGKRLFLIRASSAPPGGGQKAIMECDLSVGFQTELIRLPGLSGIDLSRDGRDIVTASTDPTSNASSIVYVPTSGGQHRELMRTTFRQRDESGDRTLEQTLQVLGRTPDALSVLVWKNIRYGQELRPGELAPGAEVREPELWSVPINGGAARKIEGSVNVTLPGTVDASAVTLSPDGHHFLVTITRQEPPSIEVSVLENFLPKAVK